MKKPGIHNSNTSSSTVPAAHARRPRPSHVAETPLDLMRVLANSPDPIWTYALDTQDLRVNRETAGYTPAEWEAGGIALRKRVFTPDSWQRAKTAIKSVRDGGDPVRNVELALHRKDGAGLSHYLTNYSPIHDADGRIVGVLMNARDITDYVRARTALQESEQRLRVLIENSPDMIWACFFDGRANFASRECCGYSVREWVEGGLELYRGLNTSESLRRLDKALEYVRLSGERVINLRLELAQRDGGPARSFLVNIAPIQDAHGAVVGMQGIMHDVSELTHAQLALAESESRFFDIIETAHDLVWSVDRDGRWTYINQAARQIYGRSPDDLVGRSFFELIHADYVEHDLDTFRNVLEGKEIVQYETVHLHSDGDIRYLSFNIKPKTDPDWSIVGAMGTARDITEQKLYQHRLEHLAEHDVLTGLHNRHYFENELERAVALASRNSASFGLLYIDLDNFKYVNDTLGHAAGDQLLLELAQLLQGRLRQGDVLARFGGDEFTVLLHDVDGPVLRQVAQSYHELFKAYTFFQGEKVFDIRVSIGAALIDGQVSSASEVLAQADLACGLAKSRGRNQAHVFNPADTAMAEMASEVSWSRKINEALEHDGFVLYFQPIVRIRDNVIDQYEVLLRMRGENGEMIAPGAFLSAAERFGLVHAIDRWVVEHAIMRLAALHRDGRQLSFAINLSGRAFEDPELLPAIRQALAGSALDGASLTFEITETAAISHIANAKEFIEELRALGCRFALDDFGSGFSSYGYLKFLPADYLKIDGGFVQELAHDPVDQAIVQSMNQVAHALGKWTIAESVENEHSLRLLRAYGVDYAQGYHLGRPSAELPPDA
ncbi:MAG TPA: EAL domain-containing protein [Acidiferrobacterales bacterium]